MQRVLVGCPTYEGYDYCLADYVRGVKNLTYKHYDAVLADNSKGDEYAKKIKEGGLGVVRGPHLSNVFERIVTSRNLLREKVLNERYDYFLSLEQDVIPPPHIIEQLMGHQKDIVSGIYFKVYDIKVKDRDGFVKDKKAALPLIFTFDEDPAKMNVCYPKDIEGNKFFQIRACGLGGVLIHRRVLEKVKFRYDPNKNTFDDMHFCHDAIENGFEIWADASIKCKHLFMKKGDVFGIVGKKLPM